jgi:hypothetical protein
MKNSLFYTTGLMKNPNRYLLLMLLVLMIAGTSCSAMKKNNCGCPSKKGMVGY